MGEEPKTYCDHENGCMFCDLLLCDGSRKKGHNMFTVDIAFKETKGRLGSEWKQSDSEKKESDRKSEKQE